ncbi:MAG: hypothetical protein JST26_19580 [Bacteroidetes bacterium]|nr:hypothetical protein [Bacteroidota bacterium]
MKILLITAYIYLFIIGIIPTKAQIISNTAFSPYKKADSVALNFPKNKYYFYTETAEELVESLNSEKEKCRVIFRWITNNIRYDHESKNKKDGQEPEIVYKHKKAVCEGYANLFKAMCDDVKLTCIVINGYAGGSGGDSHAWNIVKLDGEWYIMDPTWAAGGMKGVLSNNFIKSFDEQYWMADYVSFTKTHQTDSREWLEYIEDKYKTK